MSQYVVQNKEYKAKAHENLHLNLIQRQGQIHSNPVKDSSARVVMQKLLYQIYFSKL